MGVLTERVLYKVGCLLLCGLVLHSIYVFQFVFFSVKPFIYSLKIVNPPIKVNETAIFRCIAYVGPLLYSTRFIWFEKTHHGTHLHVYHAYRLQSRNCLYPVASIHKYTVKQKDFGKTSITCHVNGASDTKNLIDPTGKQFFFCYLP